MADLVNEMLGKFAALAQEEKNISAEMEAAFKEYNDYCSSSDSDLSEKLQHYRKKIAKVEDLMNYAREHAQPQDLEEAQMPFETSEGALESIRQTIKLDSHNDPNAESLFTKASGQKLFYEDEIERTRKLIEGSKVQAKRQYDSDIAALEQRKIQHDSDEKAYIQSEDFKQYLKLLSFDKTAFNSQGTVNLLDRSSVSIGQRRVKLAVPMEIEQDLSAISKGEYNSAARTIGAPLGISTQKGGVLALDFDERNNAYLLGGVQRLLLNFIKYFGADLTDVFFCDPIKCNPDILGILSTMAKGINPFIIVPQSIAEAQSKLTELVAQIEEQPVSGKISRIIVLHGFSENYGEAMINAALKLSEIAEKSGVLLIITHNNASPETEADKKIRQNAISVRSRNGAFWLEQSRESLFWYSAPSEIPDDVRRIYIEQRRQQASQANVKPAEAPVHEEASAAEPPKPEVPAAEIHEEIHTEPEINIVHEEAHVVEEHIEPAPVEEKPAVEAAAHEAAAETVSSSAKGNRVMPEISIGSDVDNRKITLDVSGNVAYICGKHSFGRLAVIREIIDQTIARLHPDDAELWIFDNTAELFDQIGENCAHLKYAVADKDPHVAADIVEKLGEELNSRAMMFAENGWKSYSEVPASVLLPRIIVIISDFPEFVKSLDDVKMFGRSRKDTLAAILGKCGAFGVNFVLIGDTFTENGAKPDIFKNVTVSCGVITAGEENHAEMMFDGARLYENQIDALKKVPANCAFVCVPAKSDKLSLARITPTEKPQERVFTAVSEYSDDYGCYNDKLAVIADRNGRISYADREKSRRELLQKRSDDEIMLFMGEACRLSDNEPVVLRDDFGENILMLAPVSQKKYAASAVESVILSLKEQNAAVDIMAARNNPVYIELSQSGVLDGIDVYEGEKGELKIKELAQGLAENNSERFVIVLGGDILISAMAADDSAGSLKLLLAKGSRAGCHSMFVCGKTNNLSSGFISLFRKKAVFPCPASDAEKLLRNADCELAEGAFRLSDDYDEFSVITYSK